MKEKMTQITQIDWDKMNFGIFKSGKLPIFYQILTHREPRVERTVKIILFPFLILLLLSQR